MLEGISILVAARGGAPHIEMRDGPPIAVQAIGRRALSLSRQIIGPDAGTDRTVDLLLIWRPDGVFAVAALTDGVTIWSARAWDLDGGRIAYRTDGERAQLDAAGASLLDGWGRGAADPPDRCAPCAQQAA